MFKELNLSTQSRLRATLDVNQPGAMSDTGLYRDGPLQGVISRGHNGLPEGTLLQGEIWTGPGIYEDDMAAVMIRYSSARLPDGRTLPVCIIVGGEDGRLPMFEDSKPGAVKLQRDLPAYPVWSWP